MKKIIIIAITAVICSAIIGVSLYSIQVNKQNSIEKQQLLELEQNNKIEQEKSEQSKKEYIVKRKQDCYDLETSERKKYNNVDGQYYDEEKDSCVIRYIDSNWREGDSILGEWDDNLKIFVGGKFFTKEF